jgi:serine/threonine-protein kinase SRPK3
MVFEILGVNLLEVIKRYNYRGVPLNLCKIMAKQCLMGLDYLHRICKIIHTDLKPENVSLQLTESELQEIIQNGSLSTHKTKNQPYEIKQLFTGRALDVIKNENTEEVKEHRGRNEQKAQVDEKEAKERKRQEKKQRHKLKKKQQKEE